MAVDAGGMLHHYLKKNPTLKIKYLHHVCSGSLTFRKASTRDFINEEFTKFFLNEYQFSDTNIGEIFINYFYHYRCGSNWDNKTLEFHKTRSKLFREYLDF